MQGAKGTEVRGAGSVVSWNSSLRETERTGEDQREEGASVTVVIHCHSSGEFSESEGKSLTDCQIIAVWNQD